MSIVASNFILEAPLEAQYYLAPNGAQQTFSHQGDKHFAPDGATKKSSNEQSLKMRKATLGLANSLDNFIARKDRGSDFPTSSAKSTSNC